MQYIWSLRGILIGWCVMSVFAFRHKKERKSACRSYTRKTIMRLIHGNASSLLLNLVTQRIFNSCSFNRIIVPILPMCGQIQFWSHELAFQICFTWHQTNPTIFEWCWILKFAIITRNGKTVFLYLCFICSNLLVYNYVCVD